MLQLSTGLRNGREGFFRVNQLYFLEESKKVLKEREEK